MKPKEIVAAWLDAFNRGDADEVARFNAEDALNHHVAREPVEEGHAGELLFALGEGGALARVAGGVGSGHDGPG